MIDYPALESAADALVAAFDVKTPPVPIDTMMMTPRPGMWPKIDLSQLTLSFTARGDRFAPRISIARMVVRQLVYTDWGKAQKLPELVGDDPSAIAEFGRMVLMPMSLIEKMPVKEQTAIGVAMSFMVPEDDAEARLNIRSAKKQEEKPDTQPDVKPDIKLEVNSAEKSEATESESEGKAES
jgi:hypothetical protein